MKNIIYDSSLKAKSLNSKSINENLNYQSNIYNKQIENFKFYNKQKPKHLSLQKEHLQAKVKFCQSFVDFQPPKRDDDIVQNYSFVFAKNQNPYDQNKTLEQKDVANAETYRIYNKNIKELNKINNHIIQIKQDQQSKKHQDYDQKVIQQKYENILKFLDEELENEANFQQYKSESSFESLEQNSFEEVQMTYNDKFKSEMSKLLMNRYYENFQHKQIDYSQIGKNQLKQLNIQTKSKSIQKKCKLNKLNKTQQFQNIQQFYDKGKPNIEKIKQDADLNQQQKDQIKTQIQKQFKKRNSQSKEKIKQRPAKITTNIKKISIDNFVKLAQNVQLENQKIIQKLKSQ